MRNAVLIAAFVGALIPHHAHACDYQPCDTSGYGAVNGYNANSQPSWGDNIPYTDYSQPVPQTTYGDDDQ